MGSTTVQVLVAIFMSVLIYISAFATVWPSYTLKTLEAPDSPLGYSITKSDGNLISSVIMLGSLVAMVIIGYVNEKIGRKRTVILSGLCMALAWSIISTAKSVTQLVIGRFLSGFGTGMYIVTSLIFIGEISHTKLRGTLLSIMTLMYNIGTLVSYIEGWFCSYDFINYLTLTIIVSFLVIAFFVKETPPFLLRSGLEKEALNSLKFYRGAKTTTQEILDELVYIRSQQPTKDNNDSSDLKNVEVEKEKLNKEDVSVQDKPRDTEQNSWKILMKSKSSQRAILLLSVHLSLAICMGMIGVQAYAGQFFRRAVPDISPDVCSVILAIVVTITSAVGVFIIDMIPRRVLMISSCSLAGACLAALASMLRWSWAPDWGIPLMTVFYCMFFQIGSVSVPFVQVTETISPQLSSLSSTIIMCCNFLANFVVLLLFEPVVSFLGLDGIFFLFAFMSALSAVVAYLFMRETRRIPYEVVKEMFDQGYLYRRQTQK